jgi:hypothetical protein
MTEFGSAKEVPSPACDCWRLVRPLAEDEGLPDHVCLETARATVASWADSSQLTSQTRDTWPFRLPQRDLGLVRYLGLVVQQWAEDKPNERLARRLRRWANGAPEKRLDEHYSNPKKRLTDTELAEFGSESRWAHEWRWMLSKERSRLKFQSEAALEHGLRLELQRFGLPCGPSAVAFLRALLSDADAPPPAPALLVTTRIYVKASPPGVLVEPNPDITLDGPLLWVTKGTFEAANRIAKRHQEWIKERLSDLFRPPKERGRPPGTGLVDDLHKETVAASYDRLEEDCDRPTKAQVAGDLCVSETTLERFLKKEQLRWPPTKWRPSRSQ